ncbi:MAG: carbohydrate-binding family 9-like protein [Polyangiaceae bacterium]
MHTRLAAPSTLLLPLLVAAAACDADPPRKPAPSTTSAVAEGPAIKELTAPKLDGTPLKIDGVLDEEAWSKAAATGLFVDVATGLPDPQIQGQGEAKIFWDDHHLYIALEIYDKTLRGGFPPDAKDPHLWERDTAEIMIDPEGDGDNRDYYEIQIGPQNLTFDSQFDSYNQPRGGPAGPFGHEDWSAGGERAVKLHGTLDDDTDTDDGYTVEVKIPWSSFSKAKTPPAPGSSWRMNFYAMQNNGGTAWSPILGQGNFHKSSRFGRILWSPAP